MVRRYRRWISWRWLALMILLGVIVGRAVSLRGDKETPAPFAGECRVLDVLDGETLLVQPPESAKAPAPVRLLAISVPPNHSLQSTEFLRARLQQGQAVLALDKRRIDPQGRLLAYVYVEGKLLNAELVENGFAQVVPYPGDSASVGRELYRAQDVARAQHSGIWAEGAKPLRGRAALEATPED
jgi:micrococcal nuclease